MLVIESEWVNEKSISTLPYLSDRLGNFRFSSATKYGVTISCILFDAI